MNFEEEKGLGMLNGTISICRGIEKWNRGVEFRIINSLESRGNGRVVGDELWDVDGLWRVFYIFIKYYRYRE